MKALDAILQVGRFRPSARMDSVMLLRKGGADVALQPFDVLYVPVSRIAKVDRFVDQYVRKLP